MYVHLIVRYDDDTSERVWAGKLPALPRPGDHITPGGRFNASDFKEAKVWVPDRPARWYLDRDADHHLVELDVEWLVP